MTAEDSTGRAAVRPAFLTFCALEVVAGVFYLVAARHVWFVNDDFAFLAHRQAGNLHDLFRTYNSHWVTLPILTYRFLWWTTGLRSYLPYQMLIVMLHLGVALLLWFVMRRSGVGAWTATLVGSVFVLFGAGYANIVFAFQISLDGSLFFGLVFLWLMDHDGPIDRRDALGLVAGLAALMCSGVGVVMVLIVGSAMLIGGRGRRRALLATLPLATIYLGWWFALGKRGDCAPQCTARPENLGDIVRFVVRTLVRTFRDIGQIPGLGLLVAALLAAGLVLVSRELNSADGRDRLAAPLAFLLGAFAFLVVTGIGRGGARNAPVQSRFEHVAFAMFVPALGIAVDAIVQRRRKFFTLALVVFLLAGVPGNIASLISNTRGEKLVAYRRMILTLPRQPVAKQVPRWIVPSYSGASAVTIGWLLDGVASGRIPNPGGIRASEGALATLRLSVQQRYAPTVNRACRPVGRGVLVRMHQGAHITVFGAEYGTKGRVQLQPTGAPTTDAYPMLLNRAFGRTLVATRPIAFRVTVQGAHRARVCGPA